MTDKNPMSSPNPWSMVSEGYVTETRPLFEQYCREALRLSGFDGSGKVLDSACGPGTLSLLIYSNVEEIHAVDFSQGMLDCFQREINEHNIENIKTFLMDGQNLDLEENQYDWAYSIFGLMFFPDRIKGFREMYRTLKPGCRAAVTSWAPVADSPLMQIMFGAMGEAFPRKEETNDRKILSLEDPENFRLEMEEAGFKNVSVTPFDGAWTITNINDFLDSMCRGSAPIVMIKSQLDKAAWESRKKIMLDWIAGKIPEVPVTLHSRAYIGVGEKSR